MGIRLLARAPDDEEDGDSWVPGRILGTRTTQKGAVEYKVSLDGYDSENDEWMQGDDDRVKPYEVTGDEKEAKKREADEKVAARLSVGGEELFDANAAYASASAVDLS